MSMLTERTSSILTSATLPANAKSFMVPDDHKCFDQQQSDIINSYKAAFGTQDATSTFKLGTSKVGERAIYEPSVISKDGKLVIDWGGQTFPIPTTATFASGSCTMVVEVDDVAYSLKVRVLLIKNEDLKPGATKTQTDWANCKAESKVDFLSRAYAKGTLAEITASSFDTVYKLADVVGTHDVIAFKMGHFGKYILQLADKRWVRANSSLQDKLATYETMGVEVSPACPARLTVSPAKEKKTSTGFNIHPVTLVSFRNIDLPVFSFGDVDDSEVGDQVLDAFQF
jgi:hypothetical protein